MDRIEQIQELQKQTFKTTRRDSIIVNNFYSLLTIVIMSICIILYANYILPSQKASAQKALNEKQRQEFLNTRAKQIELSHKLNANSKKEDNISK